jgi:hypothetical protein
MNWGSYFLGIASTIVCMIVGQILSPTFAELGANLHAKVWKKPYIRGQLAEDISVLESISVPLLSINQIPRFPDSYKKTSEWLLEIDTKARKIRTKKFQDIKDRLIAFTRPMNQVSSNTLLHTIIELFVKDEKAFKLVEEIRRITSKTIKEKSKK